MAGDQGSAMKICVPELSTSPVKPVIVARIRGRPVSAALMRWYLLIRRVPAVVPNRLSLDRLISHRLSPSARWIAPD